MTTVATLKVSHATQVDPANWVTPRDVYGPQLIPTSTPRGACDVQASTSPADSPDEWKQIVWTGGEPVPGRPNQRLVGRQEAGKTTIGATIGGASQRVTVWVVWAAVDIQTRGLRPSRAKSWSEGAAFPGGDACGAFVVNSFSMGENARGQVVAVAALAPAGVGRVISTAGKHGLFTFRRQVTAFDFVDGKKAAGNKPFIAWTADDSQPKLLTLDPGPDDRFYSSRESRAFLRPPR